MSAPNPMDGLADGIATAILRGLGDVIRTSLDAWWDQSAPVILSRTVGIVLGALVQFIWQTVGPLLANVQVFTRIPPQWTTDLAPLAGFHQRAQPIAAAALVLILVVSLGIAGVGVLSGKPFAHLLRAAPVFLIVSAGLLWIAPLLRWWLLVVNGLSDSMFTGSGLPGFGQMEALDRLAATGVIGIIWLCFGLWFLLKRIILIGLIIVLFIGAPFALVAGALPWDGGQRAFRWWATTFAAATIVQVFQSALLVIGGYLVASPLITGGAPSDAVQDLTSAAVGGGMILCAAWLPGFLLGGLASMGAGGAGASTILHTASILASFGGAAYAGRAVAHAVYGTTVGLGAGVASAYGAGASTGAYVAGSAPQAAGVVPAAAGNIGLGAAPAGYATLHQVAPGGHVRSVLGGAPLALPSPQKQLPH